MKTCKGKGSGAIGMLAVIDIENITNGETQALAVIVIRKLL